MDTGSRKRQKSQEHAIDVWEATWMGDLPSIKDLAERLHVNLNISEKDGMTPLSYAAGYCQEHFVGALLENGADPNLKDDFGQTPLHWALSMEGDLPVIESLAERGAGYAQSRGGRPNLPVIKLLVEHGADINAVDDKGTSYLHIAVEKGRADIVKVLIEAGASCIVENCKGQTPLDCLYSLDKLEEKKYAAVEAILAPRERKAMRELVSKLKQQAAKTVSLEKKLSNSTIAISVLSVSVGLVAVSLYILKFHPQIL